jgi:amino acid adenylation domain-containing protein
MTTMPPVASTEKRQRLLELLTRTEPARSRPVERIARRHPGIPPPLSFAQQRLWFLDKLVPGSPFYNVPGCLRIRADLDLHALRRALNEIVRRHEVLRTSFVEVDNQPVQVIAPILDIPLPCTDLRYLDETVREAEILRLATEDAQRPFDLVRGPLVRASVLWAGHRDYVFLINFHHIVADGWSLEVLVQEFQQLYAAFHQGLPSPLRELDIQYGDFAVWQHKRLAEGELRQQLNYWAAKLANLPVVDLPTDFPRRAVQGFEGETLHITLPRALSDELKEFSRRHRVTLFITLLAGLNALLHRYTGADEIIIGEPVANRNRLELERLIGFFVNSLVLRTDTSGDPTFRQLLRRSRDVVLEADANQDVPFELLVERLRPERTMGRNPLFQVSLQFFSGAEVKAGDAALSTEIVYVEKGTASLDLAFDLIDSPEGILVRAEFSTELFRRETVERMVSHYRNLLDAFVRDPDLLISAAPMLGAAETAKLLGEWNPPPRLAPFVHVIDMIRSRISCAPERIAIECGERRLSYGELGAWIAALAARLRSCGIEPESIVALVFDRSIEMVVSVLAVWEAGGAYLPVDPALPDERIRTLLNDARPRLVLTERQYAERAESWGLPTLCCEDCAVDHLVEPSAPPSGPENLAYVIYTSGSSGMPKGVMVEHGALSRHLAWMQAEFPLSADDCAVFKYAMSFDVSLVEMICPLIAGARVVIYAGSGHFDVAALARLMLERGVTVLDAVPAMVAGLFDQPAFLENRALRRVICGGDVMSSDLLDRLLERAGLEVVNMYGPTEATISAVFWRAHRVGSAEPLPIGRPAGPYTAYVLDPNLNALPVGVPGELCLGGPCLARGYLGRSDLTGQRFVRDPFASAVWSRLYRTGDRCRFRSDGNIEFLGRLDDQVKVRGHRIELGEIETWLATSPLVRSCAAALRQDSGRPELAAYVVPTGGDPEFWPSVGEYFVYDELLYHVMTSDRVRMQAYRSAIERVVRGKTVLDIGTGADLTLARLCLDAGARHVYAIEMLDEAYGRARRLAETAGLSQRLTLIHGDSRNVQLPEPVDICVSELIGTIGSSEGAIDILNDARRFLRPDGHMIPYRCVTRVAAVSLPDRLRQQPGFGEIAAYYLERIFASLGRHFDVRLCVKNLPACCIISDTADFEDLRFDRINPREHSSEVKLTLQRNARLDGLLLWVSLYPGPEDVIDVLTSECSWLPVFLPIVSQSVQLQAGDTIRATCTRLIEQGALTPDYLLRGAISSRKAGDLPFTYESRRNETAYCATPFYRSLFAPDAKRPAGRRMRVHSDERVGAWRRIYEELYAGERRDCDVEFDLVGWDSSYTGAALTNEEMSEQVAGTVARIGALGGRRVLEIGCGTGLLLLRLAKHCERYVGTDFSPAALEPLRTTVSARGLRQVELWERTAEDFSAIAPGSFDVVVLNSVVQYFPDTDYLVRVLSGAMRAVGPAGSVFIGDVRSLPLLRTLHADIELTRGDEGLNAGKLRERVGRRGRQEQELVIDPAFFAALQGELEGCSGVAVEVKRGWCHNELTRFRYDVVLQGAQAARPSPAARELKWDAFGDLPALRQELAGANEALLIRGVPNARLVEACGFVDRLEQADATIPVANLRGSSDAAGAVEPEELWVLGKECGWDIQIGFAEQDPRCCDVLCVPRASAGVPAPWSTPPPAQRRPWATYANAPAGSREHQHLAEALRRHLRTKLPDYMIPTTFVWMDALPLTPHGKLNRRALPPPDLDRGEDPTSYAAPETPLHQQIADIWKAVLGIEGFGIDANFFNIGGHSLMATQVVSRLGDLLDLNIPLRLMFEMPTIRSFADAVSGLQQGGERAIPPLPSARPAEAVDLAGLTDSEVDLLLASLVSRSGAQVRRT